METKQEEKSFNPTEFAQRKAKELQDKLASSQEEPQEELQSEEPEPSEEPQDEPQTQEEEVVQEETQEMSDRERKLLEESQALKKELARVKGDRREQKLKVELPDMSVSEQDEDSTVKVTKAEKALYQGWREEALENFLETHPEYTTNPRLKKAFEQDCQDRLPELEYAKRYNLGLCQLLHF